MAIEDIRPSSPVLLYRGLLFKEGYQMGELASNENERKYAERMHNKHKSARVFIDAMRAGRIDVNMNYPTASSWTTSKTIAERFASKNAASSQHLAMLNWLRQKGAIDGELGIVISTLARPSDIIVDLSKIELYGMHGNESEMILMPGTKKVRIAKLMTADGAMYPLDYIESMDNPHQS
jgi:hypothetical protein